ncbi:putative disease resistance protein RPP1 [Cardamine amara subsp. amara]|uniref:Disease resistance protein RPP1 n=1 Tax=Cardamine amara subsp. amara TaxID=228776 RepID=A0ABD1ATU3_CARAN
MLKSFPEISTNIRVLMLRGTAIEEVPPSIRSWPHLKDNCICHTLKTSRNPLMLLTKSQSFTRAIQKYKRFLHASRESLVWLNLCSRDAESWCHSHRFQIPDSLSFIDAQDCESLERLDCFFNNTTIDVTFGKCFKLNQEATDLIIQTRGKAVLPGREVKMKTNLLSTVEVGKLQNCISSHGMIFRSCAMFF